MLLEAFTLREQVKSFVARAGERGLGSEVVRLLTVDRRARLNAKVPTHSLAYVLTVDGEFPQDVL